MSTAVDHIEIRYRRADEVGAWTSVTLASGQQSINLTGDFERGAVYQIEARSVGVNGASSAWVQVTHTIANTSLVPLPPTGITVVSNASTAVIGLDAIVQPRALIGWTSPASGLVQEIEIQHRPTGATDWIDDGFVSASSTKVYVAGIVSGSSYSFRIRSVGANAAVSTWVEVDSFTAGYVISTLSQDGVGRGSLAGEAYTDGTAGIDCNPFTANIAANLSLSIFPGGAVIISGLLQQTAYDVYYIDPTLVGGNVTPIATTNRADWQGKTGYFLIDSIVTPFQDGSDGSRYYPSTYSDVGSRSTTSPPSAYDGDLGTAAVISGIARVVVNLDGGDPTTTFAPGSCIFQGDPAISLADDSTLLIVATINIVNTGVSGHIGGTVTITATVNGTIVPVLTARDSAAKDTYTCNIPAGTSLSTVSLQISAVADVPDTPAIGVASNTASISVYEIYIQA